MIKSVRFEKDLWRIKKFEKYLKINGESDHTKDMKHFEWFLL